MLTLHLVFVDLLRVDHKFVIGYHTSCVNAIHFCALSEISRHTTSAATLTTSTLSGRASDCILGRSLCALNYFYN